MGDLDCVAFADDGDLDGACVGRAGARDGACVGRAGARDGAFDGFLEGALEGVLVGDLGGATHATRPRPRHLVPRPTSSAPFGAREKAGRVMFSE